MDKRKQVSFDIDTNVTKKILGEQSYTKIYADIRRFMKKEGWKHIEGSVYISGQPMSNSDVAYMLDNIKEKYPYLDKCIREMHQTDISKVHSLNQYFSYDGTPGRYEQKAEQKENSHAKSPPPKASVLNKLKQNKEIVKRQEKHSDIEKIKKPRDKER